MGGADGTRGQTHWAGSPPTPLSNPIREIASRFLADWQVANPAAASTREIITVPRFGLLKQLRREFVQIVAPVDPGVASRALLENSLEVVLPQQFYSRSGRADEAIIRSSAEPNEPKSFL